MISLRDALPSPRPFLWSLVLLMAGALAAIAAPPKDQAPPPRVVSPTPAAQIPSPFATPPGGNEEYVIGAYDLLNITEFNLKAIEGKKRVEQDGTITLPLVGKVPVGGLTPQQAEVALGELLKSKQLLKDPQVSIFIEEYRSRRISVQGAVSRPGLYDMLGQRRLLDMIGEAGGLSDRAGKKIFVFRQAPGASEEPIVVAVEDLVGEGNPILNIALQPGDVIMIPHERERRIYVNGAVRQPGVIKYPSDETMTVLQAITAAGGASERANESRIQVLRRMENGGKQISRINLNRIKKGKADDFPLEENDIVYVPESFF